MKDYIHVAQYYETDQMGVVHHSNYIRWMEEARVYLLDEIGFSYKSLEEAGMISPVLNVTCEYKKMVKFGDAVAIKAYLIETNGIKFKIGYEMRIVETGEICNVGTSSHCFITREGKPMSFKKENPAFYEALLNTQLSEN